MEIKDRETIVELAVDPAIRGEARDKTIKQFNKLSSADLMEIIEENGLMEQCLESGVIGMTTHERLEALTDLEWYEEYGKYMTYFDAGMECVEIREVKGNWKATYWWNIDHIDGGESAKPEVASTLEGALRGVFRKVGEPLSDKVCELAGIERPALKAAKRKAYVAIAELVGKDPDQPEDVISAVEVLVSQ